MSRIWTADTLRKTGRDGRRDPWIFRRSTDEDGEYEIAVNDEDFWWLSECEESKEYIVDDLGSEFAEEHKRQFGR
jgi:hypothetical protein